ncbi:vitellogenin-2-like [Sander lucioperca]|uniref:vitellogenin-2-like n=1 Tax=Sander lucioperca TaxID=283035 RepID=UPI00165359CA|nr:vitellogenin-2-like [Sander lucioperca]
MTDISALRERYRSSTETQRRHTHVLLLRTVSEELAEAVSIVPVTQALRSPWEPDGCLPPPVTFDLDQTPGCEPWRLHLGLHRRSRPRDPSPETIITNSSSRRSSSSSSSSDGRSLSADSTSDWPSSAGANGSTGDPETGHDRDRDHDHDHVSSRNCEGDPEEKDPVSDSLAVSKEPNGCHGEPRHCSAAGSEEGFSAGRQDGQSAASGVSAWTGSRKSAPALRFTRQQSVGGVGSSAGGHQNQNQNQNYQPFPNRKTPRISEAARRLGMYSSF